MKVPSIAALAIATAVSTAPTAAQPPQIGSVGAFPTPSILCDTREQIQSILSAFEGSVEAGTERFAELYALRNDLREPTCAIAAIRVGLALESENVGRLEIGGEEFYGWIVHIENAGGNAYYLHLESPAEALRNTI